MCWPNMGQQLQGQQPISNSCTLLPLRFHASPAHVCTQCLQELSLQTQHGSEHADTAGAEVWVKHREQTCEMFGAQGRSRYVHASKACLEVHAHEQGACFMSIGRAEIHAGTAVQYIYEVLHILFRQLRLLHPCHLSVAEDSLAAHAMHQVETRQAG